MTRRSEDVSKELILWSDNRSKCMEDLNRYEREKFITDQKIETARKKLTECEDNIQLIKTVLKDTLLQECPECQPTTTNASTVESQPPSSSPSQTTAQIPDGQLVRTTAPWNESSASFPPTPSPLPSPETDITKGSADQTGKILEAAQNIENS